MDSIPDGSNFFSSLETTLPRQRVADLFRSLGFAVRKYGDGDFEVVCGWAELFIEAESPILMHGGVAGVVANAEKILARLRDAGIEYSADCYNENGELLRNYRWNNSPG